MKRFLISECQAKQQKMFLIQYLVVLLENSPTVSSSTMMPEAEIITTTGNLLCFIHYEFLAWVLVGAIY